ncbi:MAG: AraC family transcriptional regulator [Pseudomonadota bacterium]
MQDVTPRPVKSATLADHHRRVERVIDIVRLNPEHPFTVAELASAAAFSEFHFHRAFRAMTGESIAQCIIRLRLEMAVSALIYHPKRSVTEVAFDCGYSSSANFSKAFRKAYGCTPTDFRRLRPPGFRIGRIGKASVASSAYPDGMSTNVEIIDHPKRRLAGIRLIGAYSHDAISQLYADLGAWFQSTLDRPPPKEAISITWSDSALADQETWRLDACYEVPAGTAGSGPVFVRELAGGRTACLKARLPASRMHQISDCWDWLFSYWFPNSGTELADQPAYETYLLRPDQTGFDITLCLPLKIAYLEQDDA